MNECKVQILFKIHLCIRNKYTRTFSAKNVTHMTTFVNFISLSENSHILANTEYLARGWIVSPTGNTTSLYMDEIFFASNCSTDLLFNDFVLLFIYLSCQLRQWSSNSWYVPAWIHISQPHIIWWRWIIFFNHGGRIIE